MVNKLLDLKYKGERTYLHGSDFFNVLTQLSTELLGEFGFVEKLAFKNFAINACKLTDKKPKNIDSIVAQVRLKSKVSKLSKEFWVEETKDLVNQSYDFDENSIVARCNTDLVNQSIKMLGRTKFSPIEEIIVLTKHLNYKVSSKVPGKWVFGQLDMFKPLTYDYRELNIHMKSLIKNRFSVNELIIDGEHIGKILFIVETQKFVGTQK